MKQQIPFISGAQYYRAPTPDAKHWASDLELMRDLKFNSVKFWVQWRWSHRQENEFYFSDLDQLMDLAFKNKLQVTLNTIFDVTPLWLFEKYPDAKMIQANGKVVEPKAINCRQIGGVPGPCYNHKGALAARQNFMAELVHHFSSHPAMTMWDVWNEPEQNFFSRQPDMETMCCYCDNCRRGFIDYCRDKYETIYNLNLVWGRCYDHFEQVELPRVSNASYSDFLDFREFHLDAMTKEAEWRLEMVSSLSPDHITYLHVVPNTMRIFNSITCVDDFALAKKCDVFAGTSFAGPFFSSQLMSAGKGKAVYNVEVHLNCGQTSLHPKQINIKNIRLEFIPQIGLGIRGFMHWQFRGESLGGESPAWGLIHPDGSERPVTKAVREWQKLLAPYEALLMEHSAVKPKVAIWKSRKNEIFHFAAHHNLDSLSDSVEGYANALYRSSIPCCYIDHQILSESKLDGIKFLIMPCAYYLTQVEADSLDEWIRKGGVLLCDAHLAGYSDSGRHSQILPGCGLADKWGIYETDTTASIHLNQTCKNLHDDKELAPDVRKSLEHFGTGGGRYYQIHLNNGQSLSGCSRVAFLEAKGGRIEGRLVSGEALIVSKRVGKGKIIYAGSNLGEGALNEPEKFRHFINATLSENGITAVLNAKFYNGGNVHIDAIGGDEESPEFIAITNASPKEEYVSLQGTGIYEGIFRGGSIDLSSSAKIMLPAEDAELYVRKEFNNV